MNNLAFHNIVTAWFLPSSICLIFSWFDFEIWSFESFHMDLNTWVPLDFHPSASFPSLTIIFSLVHLKNNILNIFLK